MSASEALSWHESQFRKHWTEPRVEPLVMTDTEIAEFLDEHMEGISVVPANNVFNRIVILETENETTKAGTLREVVCLAAAKLNEANR